MWLLGVCVVIILPSIVPSFAWVPHRTPNGRIIRGEEAVPHSAPFTVALLSSGSHNHMCGGSLISPNYVLTAAHCVRGSREVEVAIGVHNWTLREPTQVRYTVLRSNFIVHPDYPKCEITCDIALIRLPESVSLNDNIQTISLSSDVIETSKKARTYGWGCTDVDKPFEFSKCSDEAHSQVLRYADVEVKAELDDNKSYNRTNFNTDVDVDGEGICMFDSGGPIVADGVQIGINDYVAAESLQKLCLTGMDGYVSIAYYLQWIKDNTDLE